MHLLLFAILYMNYQKNINPAEDLSLNIYNAASLPTLACIKWGLQTQRVFGNTVCMTIKYTQSNATQMER